MSEIIFFTPKRELAAQLNLANLISLSRDHLTLWEDIPGFEWSNYKWPTEKKSIVFTRHENRDLHPTKVIDSNQLMHPLFTQFAKAYLRYQHSIAPHQNTSREMQALRVLEMVLRLDMQIPDITKINQRHFEQAIEEIKIFKSRCFIAGQLIRILKNLAEFFIITGSAIYWKNPFVGKASYDYNFGSHASSVVKEKKLPDQDALLSIAEVFSRANTSELDDVDIMITSITCLLLSAPMRINEVLRLRVDCIDHDIDMQGNKQYYLKYWVPKIKEFDRKPIPKTMAPLALEAIERLKKITEKGRKLACYMENNPTKFYRHKNCPQVPDDQVLTRMQVAQALGYATTNSCEMFILELTKKYSLTGFTLNSLWVLILSAHEKYNKNFPYQEHPKLGAQTPLKMSESLFCTLRRQFTLNNCSPVLLTPFRGDYYTHRLAATIKRVGTGYRPLCFFTRHGFKAIKLKSHSLRHFINRLARQNNVSIETITSWSSRASSTQTLTYLNDDPKKLANKAAVLLGVSAEQIPKPPVSEEEAELLSQGPFHRSRYGICRQSWRAGPCNKFADCLNCSQLLMCKGDKVAKETISKEREHLLRTYTAAQIAINNGERSASRWTLVTGKQIERLDQLLSILSNNNIPDGSPIEITGTDFSHEQTLVTDKALKSGIKLLDRKDLKIEYGSELLNCLDLLRSTEND